MMKKTIEVRILILLLFAFMYGFSQQNVKSTHLQTAKLQLKQGSKTYNPKQALATYLDFANNGNVEAMNGLGIIYSKGIGVKINEALAIEWFNKAAQNNYAAAHFNLANLYKKGVGVDQDLVKAINHYKAAALLEYDLAWYFWGIMHKRGQGTAQNDEQAFEIFKTGANKGFASSLYAQGFMTYKGLGTKQDYTIAVTLFEQAVAKKNAAAMYMLGLCYRNGYGVNKDEQKALTLLKKAALKDYKFAKQEMEELVPENKNSKQTKTVRVNLNETDQAPTVKPNEFVPVKQKIDNSDLNGLYTGTLLRYDYSGQNLISNTPIELNLHQDNKNLTGIWKETQGDSIAFEALIQEDKIVFNNSKISRLEHFGYNKLKKYIFKNAKLQVLKNQGETYIVGNLQLYDLKEHENEKPIYIILQRNKQNVITNIAQTFVSKMVVYPNPVTNNSFELSYDLLEQTPITIKIYDMSGWIKHEQQLTTKTTGKQNHTISFQSPAGYYILNLYYGNHVIKTILIKQ